MTDEQQPSSDTLAQRALDRLRKIAAGNGLEPASITLIEIQENNFTLGGLMEVSPMSETAAASYPGPVRGKDRRMSSSLVALNSAVEQFRKQFRESPDWLGAVTKEVQSDASKGWGLENAKVTLPEHSAVFAATEICPSCQGRKSLTCVQCTGQGTVICTQCQGQGREQCYYCNGRGEDPQNPGQRCHTCNGTRYAPCRFCQTRGHLDCPTCHGKRGTLCTFCQGSGKMTQEIAVTCGAETHFKLHTKDLPSGLRRGLERVGIVNLGKGHADIACIPITEDEESPRDKAPFPILSYKVTLPYAEMRMTFGANKAVVSAFGKRCAIMGAPNFLDESLKSRRDQLSLAAQGKGSLDDALSARALKEILGLTIGGKGRLEEVRRLYPLGLSNDAIKSLLSDMQLALNKTTLKTRMIIAVVCVLLSGFLYYSLLMTGIAPGWSAQWSRIAGFGFTLLLLVAGLGTSWAALNFTTRFMLHKRFPNMPLSVRQKIGKTGVAMLGGIMVAFIACLLLSPVRMMWLALLLR